MAEDAKVSQVSELTAYAGKMQGFMESVSGNSTALINTMVQKLDGLRKKLKKAEQMEAEAVAEYNALIKAMASATDERESRALMAHKSELENKKNKAKRMHETVRLQVTVAQGATIAIIDGTKMFLNKVKTNVDKGKQVIKKSVAQLDQYKETKKKI
jgi:predicted transcriptional regulator